MRLGRVFIEVGYIVNLDDAAMVSHATEAIYEDLTQLVSPSGDFNLALDIKETPDAKESDIHSFLTDDYLTD